MGKNITFDDYCVEYFDFLLQVRDLDVFSADRARIFCADFVTNSRRLERDTTISLKGAKQKKLSKPAVPVYTNSYLVCVNANGEQLPPLMFTYDPSFDPKGPHYDKAREWCREYDISLNQIFYFKSTKKYCKEASEQVDLFMKRSGKELERAWIFHDAGNSFKQDKGFIMAGHNSKVVQFCPETHGELSVLDNNAFSIAKRIWREKRPTDIISKADLFLLRCIMDVDKRAIRDCWDRNFFLDMRDLKLQEVVRRIKRVPKTKATLIEKYIASYEGWLQDQDKEVKVEEIQALQSNLDGSYWQEIKKRK